MVLSTLLVLITLSISLRGPIIPPPLTDCTDCGVNYTTVELIIEADNTDGHQHIKCKEVIDVRTSGVIVYTLQLNA